MSAGDGSSHLHRQATVVEILPSHLQSLARASPTWDLETATLRETLRLTESTRTAGGPARAPGAGRSAASASSYFRREQGEAGRRRATHRQRGAPRRGGACPLPALPWVPRTSRPVSAAPPPGPPAPQESCAVITARPWLTSHSHRQQGSPSYLTPPMAPAVPTAPVLPPADGLALPPPPLKAPLSPDWDTLSLRSWPVV